VRRLAAAARAVVALGVAEHLHGGEEIFQRRSAGARRGGTAPTEGCAHVRVLIGVWVA